jgi:hypothetical protein
MRAVLAGVLLVALAGCVTPQSAGGYFADRGSDFAACFRGSGGPALGVHARAKLLIFGYGLGFASGRSYGWDGQCGAAGPGWSKLAASCGVPFLWNYDVDVRNLDANAAWRPFLRSYYHEDPPREFEAEVTDFGGWLLLGTIAYGAKAMKFPTSAGMRYADNYGWIEVDATPLIANVRVGFNAVHFLDFLCGWFCLDMLGNDRHVVRPGPSVPRGPRARL